MPNQPKTPSRSMRVDDADWRELARMASEIGTDRNKLLNQLVRWYLERPGVELPPRPSDIASPAAAE